MLPKRAPDVAFLKLDIYEVSCKELNATLMIPFPLRCSVTLSNLRCKTEFNMLALSSTPKKPHILYLFHSTEILGFEYQMLFCPSSLTSLNTRGQVKSSEEEVINKIKCCCLSKIRTKN